MEVLGLLAVHFVLMLVGFALMWRRVDVLSKEVASLRAKLAATQLARLSRAAARAPSPRVLASVGAENQLDDDPWGQRASPSRARYQRPLSTEHLGEETVQPLTPESLRFVAAAMALLAPLFGFLFGASATSLAAAGLTMSAGVVAISALPLWRGAAWVAAAGAAAWGTIGALAGAEHVALVLATAAAGLLGLGAARWLDFAPGAIVAAAAAATTLALGAQTHMIGSSGAAFATLALAGAMLGASSLRVEALHAGAFMAACAGLFALSGQNDAAVWFTPAAALFGAVFLGVAAARAHVLRPRGLLIVATGVAAPLFAVNALFAAQHGLADPRAAAAAFALLTLVFAGILAMAARRSVRGVTQLRSVAWVLAAGALTAATAAIFLALPTPLTPAALSAAALGLVALDRRAPHVLWRRAAMAAGLMAFVGAYASAGFNWPAPAVIACALAAPALLAAGAAHVAHARGRGTAAFFEASAILSAALTASALLRAGFVAAGAEATITFVEAGAHVAAWLALALGLAARAHRGATSTRIGASMLLGGAALATCLIAGMLWLTPYWLTHAPRLSPAVLQHAPLGFAAPAILAWAHWAYWRETGGQMRTRIAMAAAGALTAAYVTAEISAARATGANGIDWVLVIAALAAFGLGLGVNFAPGVVSGTTPRRSRL
ncbi:MAG: hypothetical protein AB7P07_03510 [Hyphomonadaceae bacterium]